MNNCIFSAHCIQPVCDKSCPTLAETSYLLERNGLAMNNPVFHQDVKYLNYYMSRLQSASGKFSVLIAQNTVAASDLVTYCAICKNWKGSQLHCTVYNLRYAKYIELLKQSWSTKQEPEELEYMRIWATSAKVLVVSNLDYVNFNDFESQTLLNLIQSRSSPDKTTIVVSPDISNLVGKGMFFDILKKKFKAERGDI